MQFKRFCVSQLEKLWAHRGVALVVVAACGGFVAEAVAETRELMEPLMAAPALGALAAATHPQRHHAIVWEGVDVDGDGRSDFTNPTGSAPRTHDAYGHGYFGASRDGGKRDHEGVDYAGVAGQAVAAPLAGVVTKIGYPYANDRRLRYVEITNYQLNFTARAFYVQPDVYVGQSVELGQTIGSLASLQSKYPNGMTDHVHLEVVQGGRQVDAATLILARMETPQAPQAGAAQVQVARSVEQILIADNPNLWGPFAQR